MAASGVPAAGAARDECTCEAASDAAPTSLSHLLRCPWGVESSRMKTTSVTFNLFTISSAYTWGNDLSQMLTRKGTGREARS